MRDRLGYIFGSVAGTPLEGNVSSAILCPEERSDEGTISGTSWRGKD